MNVRAFARPRVSNCCHRLLVQLSDNRNPYGRAYRNASQRQLYR